MHMTERQSRALTPEHAATFIPGFFEKIFQICKAVDDPQNGWSFGRTDFGGFSCTKCLATTGEQASITYYYDSGTELITVATIDQAKCTIKAFAFLIDQSAKPDREPDWFAMLQSNALGRFYSFSSRELKESNLGQVSSVTTEKDYKKLLDDAVTFVTRVVEG